MFLIVFGTGGTVGPFWATVTGLELIAAATVPYLLAGKGNIAAGE